MSEQAAAGQLPALVERIERLDEEIAALNADKRDVFAEAKANGFDVKALKAVLGIRRKDAGERAEHNAIVALYLSTLGMADAAEEVERNDPRVQAQARTRGDQTRRRYGGRREDVDGPRADTAGSGDAVESGASGPATRDAQRPSNRDVSADGEPSSGAVAQDQAPHADTGSETLARREGQTEGSASFGLSDPSNAGSQGVTAGESTGALLRESASTGGVTASAAVPTTQTGTSGAGDGTPRDSVGGLAALASVKTPVTAERERRQSNAGYARDGSNAGSEDAGVTVGGDESGTAAEDQLLTDGCKAAQAAERHIGDEGADSRIGPLPDPGRVNDRVARCEIQDGHTFSRESAPTLGDGCARRGSIAAGRSGYPSPGTGRESPGALSPERIARRDAHEAKRRASLTPLDPADPLYAIRFKARHGRDPEPAEHAA